MEARQPRLEVYKSRRPGRQRYRWRLKGANGEILANSTEGFPTYFNAKRAAGCAANAARAIIV